MGALQNHDHDHGRRDIDMEKLCEICGDVGFSDAIRVCSLCNVTREHAYCMKELHEAEVDTWICEECESGVAPQFQCVPGKLPRSARTRFASKKPPHNTKVKFISTDEAKALHSRTMINESMLQSKSQLFRKSEDKPYVPSIRLTTMASTSRAKHNTQVEVPGSKGSLNGKSLVKCSPKLASGENAHLVCRSGNVLINKHSTFQAFVKHDAKKINIHSVRTIEGVQCLPAADQASKMPKFGGHQSKFVPRRSNRSVVQFPKESGMDVIRKSWKEMMDVEPSYKGEKRGAHILETIEDSESDSDHITLFRRMIRNKRKVDEVNLKTGSLKATTRGNERRLKSSIHKDEILANCNLHGKKRKVAEVDQDSKCTTMEDEVKVNHSKETTQMKHELQENNLKGLFLGNEVKEDDPEKSMIGVNKSSKNNFACPFSTINFKEHHSEDPPLGDNSKKSTPREDLSPKNNSTTRPFSTCEFKEHNFKDAPQVGNPKKSTLRENVPQKNYSTTLPFSECDLKEHDFEDTLEGDNSNKSTPKENVSLKNNSTAHSFSAYDLTGHNYEDSTLRDVFEKSSSRENESRKSNYQESTLREDRFHEDGSDASMFLANECRDNNIEIPNLRELALLEKNRKAILLLLAHELINAIMSDEDSLLENVSMALSRSLKDSIVTYTTPSIKAITMCHSLLNENVKLKKLVADGGKHMNELQEEIQCDRTLLKDGMNKQLVLFDQFLKQVSEKLASYGDRLSQVASFVNEVQLMQKNQDALSAFELGKKVARRRLQSAILKMCPNMDWSLVEANY